MAGYFDVSDNLWPQAKSVVNEVAKARELVEPLGNTTWLTLRPPPVGTDPAAG